MRFIPQTHPSPHFARTLAVGLLCCVLVLHARFECGLCVCSLLHRYYLLAIEIRKRALGPTHLLTSHSITNLANFYNKTARFAEAQRLHREAMAVVLETFGDASPDYAQCMYALRRRQHTHTRTHT